MSDNRTPPPLATRINAALSRYRTPLIVVMTLIVVLVIGSVILYQVVQNRAERSAREAELLEEEFGEWLAAHEDAEAAADETGEADPDADAAGQDELATLESTVRERIEAILSEFPRSYGAQRALFLRGQLEWTLANYGAAIEAWTGLAERFPDSHAVATSLVNAAAAAEADGDLQQAVALWQRVADGEGAPHIEGPRALFNLGRLAEQDGRPDDALAFYRRLEADHPGTPWTRLGRSRIIRLDIDEDATGE